MKSEMQYIYQVYESGSFSKAAQALYLTQPALSIAIQKVETEIGMPLFNRDKKPLELTDAGKVYIEKVKQIMHLEAELSRELSDLSNLNTGNLVLGGTHYLNSYILPPVLTAFQKQWPGVHVELVEAGSYELVDMLRENKIDLTFNCILTPRDSFRRTPIFKDNVLIAVPASYPVNQVMADSALTAKDILFRRNMREDCPSVTLEFFADTPFVLLTKENNLHSRSLAMFAEANIKPIIRLQVTQLVTAYHLACSGLGAAFISDWMVLYDHDDMLYYKINHPLAVRQFDVVSSSRNYLSKPQKAFIDSLSSYYHPYL